MQGDCSEAVLKQQHGMLRHVKTAVGALAVDGQTGKPIKGAPTKEQILQVVRDHPNMIHWSDTKYLTLQEKLDADSPKKGVRFEIVDCFRKSSVHFSDQTMLQTAQPVDWEKLFEEDRDGNQYAFVGTIQPSHGRLPATGWLPPLTVFSVSAASLRGAAGPQLERPSRILRRAGQGNMRARP